MRKPRFIPAALLSAAAFAAPQAYAAHVPSHVEPRTAAAVDGYTEAEVRKVDKEAGKITLRHGPIASLEMPAMSMVFRAKDPAMLDRVKEGDKVLFKAEKIQGALTVTDLQPAK